MYSGWYMMGRRGKQVTRFESAMLHEPKSLERQGFRLFFVLLYTHIVPTNAFVSIPTKKRYARESALFTARK